MYLQLQAVAEVPVSNVPVFSAFAQLFNSLLLHLRCFYKPAQTILIDLTFPLEKILMYSFIVSSKSCLTSDV